MSTSNFKRGYSLLETMVALGMLGVMTYFFLNFVNSIEKEKTRLLKLKVLQEVMVSNINLIKGASSQHFPAQGKCMVKMYSISGKFVSETTLDLTDTTCSTLDTTDKSIKVILGFKKYEDINVTFDPSEYLKLPKYSKKIYEIDIQGIYKNEHYREKLGLTIIKR